MYKKLQRKFLLISSLVLFLVIASVVGIVYLLTSGMLTSQTRVLMDLILDNGGELPDYIEFDKSQEDFLALSAEAIHETRYFSVALSAGGQAEILDMQHIIAISSEEALELAERVQEYSLDYGMMRLSRRTILRFAKQAGADGSVMIVFLDSTSRYSMMRLILLYVSALWMAVWLLYVMVMARFSGRLVKPFVENDERQKRFITNASHELKTPLAVISANTEMCELMGGKSKWTESTRRQTSRLQSLIEDLVVLARLDEMKEMELGDVDVSAMAAESCESFRGVIENSGRTFACELAEHVHAKADRRSLQQLFSILLDNAAKYCDEGGQVSVTLISRMREKGALLTVANTYAEGKDVDFSRFFERFYRQDESHNSEKSGFGIGLSMGKEIAERMKGKLKADYAGDMLRFTLSL